MIEMWKKKEREKEREKEKEKEKEGEKELVEGRAGVEGGRSRRGKRVREVSE